MPNICFNHKYAIRTPITPWHKLWATPPWTPWKPLRSSLQYSTNRSPWIQHIRPLKKYLSLLGELIFEVHALHDLVLNISQPKTKKKKLITSSSFMTKCIVMCAGCSALSFYMKDFKVGSTESEGWERKNWYRMGSRRQFNYEFTLKDTVNIYLDMFVISLSVERKEKYCRFQTVAF